MIAAGLLLSVASAVAINGGHSLQHASASRLPPLRLRHPFHALHALFGTPLAHRFPRRHRRLGAVCRRARLAPLSLVQAASAGVSGCSPRRRPARPAERVGVAARPRRPGVARPVARLAPARPAAGRSARSCSGWSPPARRRGARDPCAARRRGPRNGGRDPLRGRRRRDEGRGRGRNEALVRSGASSPATGSPSSACSCVPAGRATRAPPGSRCSGRTPCRSSRA